MIIGPKKKRVFGLMISIRKGIEVDGVDCLIDDGVETNAICCLVEDGHVSVRTKISGPVSGILECLGMVFGFFINFVFLIVDFEN